MGEFTIMLRNVLVFVALAIPGYLLVKSKMLKPEQSGVLSKILMYLAMPFLIFSGVVNNLSFNKELLTMMAVVTLAGIVYTFAIFFVSKPLTAGEKEQKTQGMMRFCSVFSNNGFLGIPLAIAVFGRESQVFGVLIILNIINNVLMYTLGAYLTTGDKRNISFKKAFLNPVLIAFVLGCIFNLLHIADYVPEIAVFSDHFSNVVTPISMTIIGIKLATVRLGDLLRSRKLYYVSFLKLVLFPVVIVALLLTLKALPVRLPVESMVLGAFIAFATPTAGLATTFADEFGGDAQNAVVFTLGTTVFSVLTIPTLYWVLNLFL